MVAIRVFVGCGDGVAIAGTLTLTDILILKILKILQILILVRGCFWEH